MDETSQLSEAGVRRWVQVIILFHLGLLFSVAILDAIASSQSDRNRSEPLNSPTCCLPVGLATGQACFLGAYLACMYQSFAFRLRWAYRLLACQWFCFTVPYFFLDYYVEWPVSVAIDQLLLATAAFLATGILRLSTGSVIVRGLEQPTLPKSTIRIVDLLILMTIIALMIGVGMRYRSEQHGWEGLLYAVIVIVGVVVGCPLSAILSLSMIAYLVSSPRIILGVSMFLSGAIMAGLTYLFIAPTIEPQAPPIFILLGVFIIVPTLLTTLAFRGLGYRFRKIAAKSKTTDIAQPLTEALI